MFRCNAPDLFAGNERPAADIPGKPLHGHLEFRRRRLPEHFRRPAEHLRVGGDAVQRLEMILDQEGLTGFPRTASPAICDAVRSSRRTVPAAMWADSAFSTASRQASWSAAEILPSSRILAESADI